MGHFVCLLVPETQNTPDDYLRLFYGKTREDRLFYLLLGIFIQVD
jgi:hypothetical protein